MKNSITRYFPVFCDVDDKERVAVEFDSLEELVEIPWVKSRSADVNFDRFSVSGSHLMAEYKNPREWWVVGFLKHPVNLPALDTKK